jgi:hypothetical protein
MAVALTEIPTPAHSKGPDPPLATTGRDLSTSTRVSGADGPQSI